MTGKRRGVVKFAREHSFRVMKTGHGQIITLILCAAAALTATAHTRCFTVADSVSRRPLGGASVFDSRGNFTGITRSDGRSPYLQTSDFPATVRYLGFREKAVAPGADTVFLSENSTPLPEIVIESRQHKVMHILAYVREYSTLATYTDTVFLFREKMVDYMLTPDRRVRFDEWSCPRVLKSRSYYRFTDAGGLDSVSDKCGHHFSWSDWIGMPPEIAVAPGLHGLAAGTDSVGGLYGPAEVWTKTDSRLAVDVDVLADSTGRKWVPRLSAFFRHGPNFENFRIRFNFENTGEPTVTPADMEGYSFNIESRGRGREMFMFNRSNEPFFVSTYAEVYVTDKEYITLKEARKWERRQLNMDEAEIFEPPEAPDLQPPVKELIARVETVDSEKIRLDATPDHRMVSKNFGRRNFRIGHRALALLKQLVGITLYKSHKNMNRNWEEFRNSRLHGKPAQPSGDY